MTAQRRSDNKPSRRWQMPGWHARFPRDRAPTRGLVGPHHRSVGHGVLGQSNSGHCASGKPAGDREPRAGQIHPHPFSSE